jgi:hypothetical protein
VSCGRLTIYEFTLCTSNMYRYILSTEVANVVESGVYLRQISNTWPKHFDLCSVQKVHDYIERRPRCNQGDVSLIDSKRKCIINFPEFSVGMLVLLCVYTAIVDGIFPVWWFFPCDYSYFALLPFEMCLWMGFSSQILWQMGEGVKLKINWKSRDWVFCLNELVFIIISWKKGKKDCTV